MPFMIGTSPIRRTTKYLESGKVFFRENVKIFSINYDTKASDHQEARNFVFWHLPQIQYKNPKVQCVTFQNLTPTPFIRIFFDDAKSVLIDIDGKEKEDILHHLTNFTAVCKTPAELKDKDIGLGKTSLSYFGFGCKRHCICEILGQVPCPHLVTLPNYWRGKFHKQNKKEFKIPPCYMVRGLEDKEGEEEYKYK